MAIVIVFLLVRVSASRFPTVLSSLAGTFPRICLFCFFLGMKSCILLEHSVNKIICDLNCLIKGVRIMALQKHMQILVGICPICRTLAGKIDGCSRDFADVFHVLAVLAH